MTHLQCLYLFAVLAAAVAAIIDWRHGIIPNWLTLPLLVLGIIAHVSVFQLAMPGLGLSKWFLQCAAGMLICGLVPFIMWKKQAMGGGDLKLLVALGALLGPVVGMEAQLYAFIAALMIAPIKLAYEGKLLMVIVNTFRVIANPLLPKHRQVPVRPELLSEFRFGPAVLVGVVAASTVHWSAAGGF